jgi:hypothetical protein
MNPLHKPEKYYISNLDGGAETCFLGQDGNFFQFITPEEQM